MISEEEREREALLTERLARSIAQGLLPVNAAALDRESLAVHRVRIMADRRAAREARDRTKGPLSQPGKLDPAQLAVLQTRHSEYASAFNFLTEAMEVVELLLSTLKRKHQAQRSSPTFHARFVEVARQYLEPDVFEEIAEMVHEIEADDAGSETAA